MRITALSIGLLAILTPLSVAWTKEDREIFRVRDELIAHEGPDVTFYDFLGVSPTASQEDINKAYKKRSRSLHPDKVKQQLAAERAKKLQDDSKNKGHKKPAAKPPTPGEIKAAIKRASERQARLSIVANILRASGRDRYDHFLANGFPTWKGTEYYYSRYRPGLGTALFGVFLVAGGGAHYIALYMSWKRQREFVERYIKYARDAAWGPNLAVAIPGLDTQPPAGQDDDGPPAPANRKMRRLQQRDAKKDAAKDGPGGRRARRGQAASATASGSATPPVAAQQAGGPTGAKKRVVAENGKVLVVDSLGDVYLEQEDEDGKVAEFLLDPNELPRPTFRETAVVRLPVWAYAMTVGRLLPQRDAVMASEAVLKGAGEAQDVESSSEAGKATPSTDSEDFELLDKSVDELDDDKAKTTATTQKQAKVGKRKNRKR